MMSIGTGNTMVELSGERGGGWGMVEELTLGGDGAEGL